MSEGSYIVEVWNQDGLFSGPGQVMAPSSRKAAITVMRNIGRPQLSAGGQPFVVHVQDLKEGTEYHYGWPSKEHQAAAPGADKTQP